jgi:hypothetical protein
MKAMPRSAIISSNKLLPYVRKRLILGLVLGLAALQGFAQPAALIETVQMPAWRERDGKRMPLVPIMVVPKQFQHRARAEAFTDAEQAQALLKVSG